MKSRLVTYLQSPVGLIEISGTGTFITSVLFVEETEVEADENVPEVLLDCKRELEEYFAGTRQEFTVKLKAEGSIFQKKVWNELKKIPFGSTCSYNTIAKKLHNPDAVRAVGLANGKNPIAIILPCHRVIGEDGKLTGYAGGLWRKQWLLEHEGKITGNKPLLF
ncbi:MAG: methylated-DNA--[protein]-cysteine S-methyltransferase [Chitinophagales bacterium]|nr:methylated-DNA--[protein]-cysteine S-methyltransferase [Chitinophagales bacterium]